MKVENIAQLFARREELRKKREELKYAQSMSGADWRYASIARMIEADITRMTYAQRSQRG